MAIAAVETDPTESGLTRFAASFRPLDAFLFALFIFDRFLLPIGVAGGVVLGVVLVGIGAFRKPAYRVRGWGLIALALAMLLAYLALGSAYNGVDFGQRLLRISILFALILTLAAGKYHFPSALTGLIIGAVLINAPAYYLGLTSDNYAPYLTGWFGDKNVAGMWYAVVAALGLYKFRTGGKQLAWLVVAGGLIFLTGSRTSIAALLVALVWFFIRERASLALRLGVGGLLLTALNFAEENLARIGIFEDREGSDWLRSRISDAVWEKASNTPWHGMGLSTADVPVGPRFWFFHNSYMALFVEGGYLLAVVIVLIFAVVGGGLLSSTMKVSLDVRVAETATVVILVCAWQLGEVFFTSAAALVLGYALWARFATPLRPPVGADEPTSGARDAS